MTESMQDAGTKATARGPSVGADSLQAISAKHRIDSSSDKNSEGDDELAAPVVRSNYWESKLSLSATKQIPLAGSTPYPLPADVTNTHPLYTHPAYIPQDPRRLSHVPHRSLVGEPGVRHGTQNQPLQDPFETAQDPDPRKWTGPEEKSRWERECEGIYYQQYTAPSKSKRGRPRLPTSKAAEAGKSKSQTKPKATATKRVKGKRIERAFIIGSEAWPLDETNTRKPDTPAEHTKGWRVYVKVPEGQPPITTWLKKVQFKIFHTYSNPTRVIEEPPFQIEETGWGGFTVEIKLFFVPEVGSRPQDRTHFLQLEPYGSDEEMQKQKEGLMVRSDVIDIIEFNEPTEALFDMMTDEAQFKKPRGKGKGKMGQMKREEGEELSVGLAEKNIPTNQYSKETEAYYMELFSKAHSQLGELFTEEDRKLEGIRKEKAERMREAGVQS